MRTSVRVATVLLVTLAALSCGRDEPLRPGGPSLSSVSADSVSPVTYVIDLDALVPPPFLDAQIQRAGGELTASLDKIGVAIATSSDPAFASRVAKLRGVCFRNDSRLSEHRRVRGAAQNIFACEREIVEKRAAPLEELR